MDISEYVENNSNNLQVENEELPVHLAVLRIHLILMRIRIFFSLVFILKLDKPFRNEEIFQKFRIGVWE